MVQDRNTKGTKTLAKDTITAVITSLRGLWRSKDRQQCFKGKIHTENTEAMLQYIDLMYTCVYKRNFMVSNTPCMHRSYARTST